MQRDLAGYDGASKGGAKKWSALTKFGFKMSKGRSSTRPFLARKGKEG